MFSLENWLVFKVQQESFYLSQHTESWLTHSHCMPVKPKITLRTVWIGHGFWPLRTSSREVKQTETLHALIMAPLCSSGSTSDQEQNYTLPAGPAVTILRLAKPRNSSNVFQPQLRKASSKQLMLKWWKWRRQDVATAMSPPAASLAGTRLFLPSQRPGGPCKMKSHHKGERGERGKKHHFYLF